MTREADQLSTAPPSGHISETLTFLIEAQVYSTDLKISVSMDSLLSPPIIASF